MTLLSKKFCTNELRAAQGYATAASIHDLIDGGDDGEEEEES